LKNEPAFYQHWAAVNTKKNIEVLIYKKRKMHRHALQNKRLARFLTTRTSNFRKGSQNVRKEYLEKSAGSGSIQLSVFGDKKKKKKNRGGGGGGGGSEAPPPGLGLNRNYDPGYMSRKMRKFRTDKLNP
jgi:hypothetical protein